MGLNETLVKIIGKEIKKDKNEKNENFSILIKKANTNKIPKKKLEISHN